MVVELLILTVLMSGEDTTATADMAWSWATVLMLNRGRGLEKNDFDEFIQREK